MPSDAPAAAEPDVVASLLVETAAPAGDRRARPLIQLARVIGDGATPGETEQVYAVGMQGSGRMTWHGVGRLDLHNVPMERMLFAGLSVLAMKHVRDAGVQIGDPVLVLGADPWSRLLLQWARLQGASPLVLVRQGPPPPGEEASSAVADATLQDPTPGDLARAVKLTHRAAGFAAAFDAIASERSMTQALSALRDGGCYVLAGLNPQAFVGLNAYPDLHRRDLQIVSPMHSPIELDVATMFRFSLDLADRGRLRLDGLLGTAQGWRIAAGRDGPSYV